MCPLGCSCVAGATACATHPLTDAAAQRLPRAVHRWRQPVLLDAQLKARTRTLKRTGRIYSQRCVRRAVRCQYHTVWPSAQLTTGYARLLTAASQTHCPEDNPASSRQTNPLPRGQHSQQPPVKPTAQRRTQLTAASQTHCSEQGCARLMSRVGNLTQL